MDASTIEKGVLTVILILFAFGIMTTGIGTLRQAATLKQFFSGAFATLGSLCFFVLIYVIWYIHN